MGPKRKRTDTSLKLWCFIKGDSIAIKVTPVGGADIYDLKHLIWEERKNNGVLRGTDASGLVLWKVSSEGLANISQLTSYP